MEKYNPTKTLQIYTSNLNNNFSFIRDKFILDKLYIGDEGYLFGKSNIKDLDHSSMEIIARTSLFTDNQFEQLRTIIKVVQEVFPDRWNLELYETDNGNVYIQGISILFPELTIANSEAKFHDIKDLVIQLPIGTNRFNMLIFQHIFGKRLTVFDYEDSGSGYQHSHLSTEKIRVTRQIVSEDKTKLISSNVGFPYPFCLGDSELSNIVHNFRNINVPLTENTLVSFFVYIFKLATWESLEGGPYRRISEVLSEKRNFLSGRDSVLARFDYKFLNPEYTTNLDFNEGSMATLLSLVKREFPNFYPKYEVHNYEITGKDIRLQNEEDIYSTLSKAFINVTKDMSDSSNDTLEFKRGSSDEDTALNLQTLCGLFCYDGIDNTKVGIVPRLTKLPESIKNKEDSEGIEYSYISENPVFIFRGEYKYARVIKTQKSESKIKTDELKNVELKQEYKKKIKSYILKKLYEYESVSE